MSTAALNVLKLTTVIALLVVSKPSLAQTDDAPNSTDAPPEEQAAQKSPEVGGRTAVEAGAAERDANVEALRQLLKEQADKIEAQRKDLARQVAQIEQQGQQLKSQQAELTAQAQLLAKVSTRLDQVAERGGRLVTEREAKLREQVAQLQDAMAKRFPETPADLKEVPVGSIPLPGVPAVLKVGGRVKTAFVESVSGLGTTDRFIVGTIPTVSADAPESGEFTVTTEASRLNFDYRQQTSFGPMRAYIEGDFAGNSQANDTGTPGSDLFRSRHAFGQFEDFLIGKTWSNLVDVRATPESIDFEGLNGRNNVRQAQIRYFPSFGQNHKLSFSLESTEAEIANADGVSKIPDITAKWERKWFNQWEVQSGVVVRNLDGETSTGANGSGYGYGLTVSGSGNVGWFGNERDTFMFQVNLGKGIGHYINDTDTVGGQDGFFDADGDLKILPIWAGYVATEHWWNQTMRSTFVFGWTDVLNQEGQPDDAYNTTYRATGNFIWSPIPNIDIGAELLWGQRTDNDGNKGRAEQVQAAATYNF